MRNWRCFGLATLMNLRDRLTLVGYLDHGLWRVDLECNARSTFRKKCDDVIDEIDERTEGVMAMRRQGERQVELERRRSPSYSNLRTLSLFHSGAGNIALPGLAIALRARSTSNPCFDWSVCLYIYIRF